MRWRFGILVVLTAAAMPPHPLLASLDEIDGLLGKARGYELARIAAVSESYRHLYLLIRCDKQPLFVHFLAYRPVAEWQVNVVRWSTDIAAVFPEDLAAP